MAIANQRNFATGLLYTAVGVAVVIGASRYQIGSAARMGPGYFPLGLGIALIATGIFVGISSLGTGKARVLLDRWPMRNIVIVLSSVLLFAFCLERFGLIVALPVLIAVSSLAHPNHSWKAVLVSIAVLAPLTWLIFIKLLALPFPVVPPFLMQ